MTSSNYKPFKEQALLWRRLDALVGVLYAGAFALLATALIGELAGWSAMIRWSFFSLLFATSVGMYLWFRRGRRVEEVHIARHLDRIRPELQESATLLVRPESNLNPLEALQRLRVRRQLDLDPPRALYPLRRLYVALACFAVSGSIAFLLFYGLSIAPTLGPGMALADADRSEQGAVVLPVANESVRITDLSIEARPPAYTGLPVSRMQAGDMQVAEGSRVQWRISTNRPGAEMALVLAIGDTLESLRSADGPDIVTYTATATDIYHIVGRAEDGRIFKSPYYRLDVVPDAAPRITVLQPDLRTVVEVEDTQHVSVDVDVEDDYGLGAAQIVATMTRGSGENVRFREDTLRFAQVVRHSDLRHAYRVMLDLPALGLAPGDELYFYVEAEDRRVPTPHRSRSDTYFVVMPDTVRQTLAFSEGLPIDRLPAYFRSQRQIIIDTEKLIAERDQISEDEFRDRSNGLGIDQKLLRLRYGQFLGEEFESDLGPATEGIDGSEDHDGEDHEHEAAGDPNEEEDPADAFTHFHDYEENATLFSVSSRTLLKSALAEMWDAELQLRLYRPELALPYEYRALELLKEVQQRSRIYVKRIGFEPPPLKPDEQRLAGELDDIESRSRTESIEVEPGLPEVRSALSVLQRFEAGASLTEADLVVLERAGQSLARVALEEPGRYLAEMQNLRMLIAGEPCTGCLNRVERAFWQILPPAPLSPIQRSGRPGLINQYYERLESQ